MKVFGTIFVFVMAIIGCNAQSSGVQNLPQADLQKKLQEDNVVLIDVRTPTEISACYIPEAAHFININDADFETKIAELDTTKTYVMYCRSGARSGRAANFMASNGFTNVYNLEGGILGYKGTLKQ